MHGMTNSRTVRAGPNVPTPQKRCTRKPHWGSLPENARADSLTQRAADMLHKRRPPGEPTKMRPPGQPARRCHAA
jgi:hypothetical protein